MNIKNDVKMATSSIRITKICQWCGVEFEAQKVSTKYCSHRCANLAYKQAVRDKRVKQAEAETLSIKLEKPIENVKDKEYLSFAQAGKLLGLSRQAVYNMVKAGNLKASKISSRLSFIKRTDIDAMLENKPYKTLHPKDSVPMSEKLNDLFVHSSEFNGSVIKIISGMANGADTLAIRYADEHKMTKVLFPANWKSYPRIAGFLRNRDMLNIATHLIAFWDGKSSGTKDMIDIAQEKGIPVWIFNY